PRQRFPRLVSRRDQGAGRCGPRLRGPQCQPAGGGLICEGALRPRHTGALAASPPRSRRHHGLRTRVEHAPQRRLLPPADADGFEVFVTTDQNLRYQQNLAGCSIAVVVLLSTSWPKIQSRLADVARAVDASTRGGYVEVAI